MTNKLHCIIIQLILLLVCSEAIIVSKSFKVRSYVREFERFGFADGGTIKMTGKPKPVCLLTITASSDPNFDVAVTRVFICTNDNFNRVVNEVDTGSNTEVTKVDFYFNPDFSFAMSHSLLRSAKPFIISQKATKFPTKSQRKIFIIF
jgi:hypothetical protein